MEVFDLAIVYLALGAPFAVSEYLQRREPARAAGVFVFWPAQALTLMRKRFTSDTPTFQVFDARTSRIGEKLQRTLAESDANLLEFRAAFDRYVGLGFEIKRSRSTSETKSAELLRISGRESSHAADMALSRRNAVRLERHHIDARVRFLELIERSNQFDATMLALELATVLQDDEARSYLDRVVGHDRTKGEVWNTQEQQAPPNTRIAA